MEPLFLLPGMQAESDLFRGSENGSGPTRPVDRGDAHRYDIGVTYTDPGLSFLYAKKSEKEEW
jgi:hypothetical protein